MVRGVSVNMNVNVFFKQTPQFTFGSFYSTSQPEPDTSVTASERGGDVEGMFSRFLQIRD